MNPYSSLCDDFGVYVYLNTKMELPSNRETVLHFFESLRKQFPEMTDFDKRETGEFVLASSGEHDLALAPGVRPELVSNAWFAGDDCTGVCACFSAAAGPATLLALADVGGDYRLIAAEGAFTGRSFPSTGTANGGFLFDCGLDGWAAWCRFGANHHSSASRGSLAASAAACARFAGISFGVA